MITKLIYGSLCHIYLVLIMLYKRLSSFFLNYLVLITLDFHCFMTLITLYKSVLVLQNTCIYNYTSLMKYSRYSHVCLLLCTIFTTHDSAKWLNNPKWLSYISHMLFSHLCMVYVQHFSHFLFTNFDKAIYPLIAIMLGVCLGECWCVSVWVCVCVCAYIYLSVWIYVHKIIKYDQTSIIRFWLRV